MKFNAEQLGRKWLEVFYHEGGYLRLDLEHHLEWYIGYRDIDLKSLVIVSNMESDKITSSKSFQVAQGYRQTDGKWTISINLIRNEQEEVFHILCCDLIEYSNRSSDEYEALQLIQQRLKQWNRLLENQKMVLMDESRKKGLIGELIYLMKQIEIGMNKVEVLNGWVGPEGSDQDFIFSDCWCEVKTIGLSAEKISISSAEQLANRDYGEIAILRVDKCSQNRTNSFTLKEIVNKVNGIFNDNTQASETLEKKLSSYGYIDIPEYDSDKYYYSGMQRFEIKEDFPRLTRINIPNGIDTVKYEISIASIDRWKL